MSNYTIANGETNAWTMLAAGDNLLVQSGGTLNDAALPYGVASAELAAGAVLSGDISVGCNLTTVGEVDTSSLEAFDFDISGRQEEDGLILDDITHIDLSNVDITITVDSDQDKGKYRLAGNVAEFDQTITVKNTAGTILGTLSLEDQILDFNTTRYILSLDTDNELCLTVDSTTGDGDAYVLLYKKGKLVDAVKSVDGITISADGDYDQMIVLNGGAAENITVTSGGQLTLYSGGRAEGVTVTRDGRAASFGVLDMDLRRDDGTVVSGTWRDPYYRYVSGDVSGDDTVYESLEGAFSFADNVAHDLVIASSSLVAAHAGITVDGACFLGVDGSNYAYGSNLYIGDGAVLTGTVRNVGRSDAGVHVDVGGALSDADVLGVSHWEGQFSTFVNATGGSVERSHFNWNAALGATDAVVRDITVEVGASFSGECTLSDVAAGGGQLLFYGGSHITLEGDLTISAQRADWGGSTIDANGHTIRLDYTTRTVKDIAMLDLSCISEDAHFTINLLEDQAPGEYSIATNCGSFIDSFDIVVDGETVGTLDKENDSFVHGNWVYTMAHDAMSQELNLTISLKPDAPDGLRVWVWDHDGVAHHAASYTDITVGDNGDYARMVVLAGGAAENITVTSGGQLTLYSGGRAEGVTVTRDGRAASFGVLDMDLRRDDGTVVSGTWRDPYYRYVSGDVSGDDTVYESLEGAFSFADNVAHDLVIASSSLVAAHAGITVDGACFLGVDGSNYAYGSNLYIGDGAVLTGTVRNVGRSDAGVHVDVGGALSDADVLGVSHWEGQFSTFVNATGGSVERSHFNWNAALGATDAVVRDITVEVGASFSGECTLSDVAAGGGQLLFYGGSHITLEGDLTISAQRADWGGSTIDANGHTIRLDYTTRTVKDLPMLDISVIRNSEVSITLNFDQVVGSYLIGFSSTQIGQGDAKGIWNPETNEWDLQGSTFGDLDGIIELRDENGILLANCTVNGETEYFGRYNYTVYVDDEGTLKLDIGWNNKEGRTYEADGNDNDTRTKATLLPASGTKATIHSAEDVDWYKFTLDTRGHSDSSIGISFKQWAGDLDIWLYDAQGNQLDYAKSVTDNERISLKGYTAGDYYLKVAGYNSDINEYTLDYSLPAAPTLEDPYERGNTALTNHYLGGVTDSVSVHAAIGAVNDVDYYSFAITKKGIQSDTVTLTFDPEYGDLDLYLYDVNGLFQLGKSISTDSGTETISLKGLSRGVYIVKVISKDGLTVCDYDLAVTIHSTEVSPDKYENNNTLKKAKNLYALNGHDQNKNLSIHDESDIDYFKFKLKETGSADDWIQIDYEASLGDLDIEILDANGDVVAWSRTAENFDQVSLKGLEEGDYYIKVSGYDGAVNNYDMSWNVTNSSLIASDAYEGNEPIAIRENQTITGLSIAKTRKEDETRADTFKITLEHNAWKRSKIILSDYRSDWEDGMAYILKDAQGNMLQSGNGSEISLAGLAAGDYYLTVDTPNDNEYTTYSVTAQSLPDSDEEVNNTWTLFVYLAGDNNLEGAYLTELLYMQRAILPEDVEVYVLMDRNEGYSTAQRDWTDTRVGKIRHSMGGAVAVEWMYFDGVNTSTYMNTSNLELKKEWDTGDVSTLEAFLDWGMKTAPAENYALIMKDHGSSLGYNSTDNDSGSIMSIAEISQLLSKDKYSRLSVAAFDQCLMGSDVVVTTMEGTVDYVVASEAVGYTPNQLMMYKVLFNSLATDMTPQELAQKMVKACNCSGQLDLTLASFDTGNASLSAALNAFGEAAAGFARNDWVAICKSFALAHNYGDGICAYSDLGFLLNAVKGYAATISSTLLTAAETLYDFVIDTFIDAAQITPAAYGTGLAVFNPVLSAPYMNAYSYGPGANLDYYGTAVGQTAWGDFLYTVGQLAEDCTEYFTDNTSNLTFTDFVYSFENHDMQVTYNLGAFYGDGVEYRGLYMDDRMVFTVTLEQAGVEGDAIRVVADNPDANITLTLVQSSGQVRRTSTNGTLSLKGVDPDKAGVLHEYTLVISSDKETTFDLYFDADWTSGSDYFDYSRSNNKLGGQGNGSIDKATVLAAGNYGGLVTYAGDADFYQLKTVYTEQLDIVVKGTGLVVREYDKEGTLLQTATEEDGAYSLTVANGNYLYVEGMADLSQNAVNAYSLAISDIAHTYLSPAEGGLSLPAINITPDTTDWSQQVVFTAEAEEGMATYYSLNLFDWTPFQGSVAVTENALYYFKAVNPETQMESKYISREITNIDTIMPVIELTGDTLLPLQKSTLTASTEEGLKLYYNTISADFGGEWTEYIGQLEITANGTYYFKATDAAGNIGTNSIVFANIDTLAPVITLTGHTETPLWTSLLTAAVSEDAAIEYSLDGGEWQAYTETIVVAANGTYRFRATDAVGNTGAASITFSNIGASTETTEDSLSWAAAEDASGYIVEYSRDGFETVVTIETATVGVEHPNLPEGTWQWRVKAAEGAEWAAGETITVAAGDGSPSVVAAVEDGVKDVFFVKPVGVWSDAWMAEHMGVHGEWAGTGETVVFGGENRFADIFQGSSDENVLLLTDDANGDALFVYDIYTESKDDLAKFQSRLAEIKEIHAGAGDDIVDLTSDKFDYAGGGLSIHGGLGDDTIWANAGDNTLFGDAGNDRIVGAGGNDVLAGGLGDDSMHGGGGDDVFVFGDNWGNDTVEQLQDGKVTLWFKEGDESKWDGVNLTYHDGGKSVQVNGVAAENITLKFGDDGSRQYDKLLASGAFDEFSSERIFEDKNKGMLA